MTHDADWLLALGVRTDPQRHVELASFLSELRPLARRVVARHLRKLGFDPTGRRDEIDDVVQEAEVAFALDGVSVYRGDSSPRAYYLRIVHNEAVSAYRPRRATAEIALGKLVSDGQDPAAWLERRGARVDDRERAGLRLDLELMLARLYERVPLYAEAVDLYLFQAVGSADDCAALVGTTRQGFHQRLSRGARALAGLLRQAGYDD